MLRSKFFLIFVFFLITFVAQAKDWKASVQFIGKTDKRIKELKWKQQNKDQIQIDIKESGKESEASVTIEGEFKRKEWNILYQKEKKFEKIGGGNIRLKIRLTEKNTNVKS